MGSTPVDMRDRWDAAMSHSRDLCASSTRLMATSLQARAASERARLDAAAARTSRQGAPAPRNVETFSVHGMVDDQPARASYHDGVLECTAELARRAEVVVAIGETFDAGDSGPTVQASLDDTVIAALLTVMRAYSQITSVELGVRRPVPGD